MTRKRIPVISPLRENKDLISDLPDELLGNIICMLDMKDAVKASSLSKRWRNIWTKHVVDLKFNHVNITGLKFIPRKKKEFKGLDTAFVGVVDKIMKLRCEEKRDKINSFCLQFPLGKSFSPLIDKWLNFAIGSRVETIDLDLSAHIPSAGRYNFSLLRTVSNYEKRTLKHLRLANCNFRGWSSSPKFGLLISLQLKSVTISSLQIAMVLESCPLLEELTLDTCRNLTELTINATRLKHLSVTNCLKIKEIDMIQAQNLVYLQLRCVSITSLHLKKFIERCPLLEELTLNKCPQLTYLRIGNSTKNCTLLKHLSLTKCSNLVEIDVKRAQNLISLKLKRVLITDLQLTNIIETSPLLEELTLLSCYLLTYLRILESDNSRLKSLHLDRCSNLKEIDLCANLLHTLEYNGILQWFSFKKCPRLINVFIGEDIHLFAGELLITRIARDIPSIENLIFGPYYSLKFFYTNDPEPVFSMRRLVLNIIMRNKKEELIWVNSILNDFPLLETLELNLGIKSRKQVKEKETFEKCPNRCITKLEVNGFEGNKHQVDLLEFLLENLTGLRVLAIGPCRKTYISFNSWVYGKAHDKGKKWFEDRSEWLRTIISPLVHLEFLRIEP
ncbi:F-box/LRR-repeat protein 2-like [Impatiens glandulifera]|uniref:F-box/LRR-repeat protein 2-like n=1 Tax=Impatiens glandulifera TaxID=253017 RepID=UPI001FB19AF3|nr:F-box/LRR-repeat protein 2-like [Impatiens glandulifera]